MTSHAMVDDSSLSEVCPPAPTVEFSGAHVVAGLPVPKTRRLELFSPEEWEEFVEEWASSLTLKYALVRRFSGPGDMGIDVAGFIKNTFFSGGWDNYQCKHYDHAVRPGDIWVEIGKIIYYSFTGEYPCPKHYYFVAPFGMGTGLTKLLADPDRLKVELVQNWDGHCRTGITKTATIELSGGLAAYVDAFDFGIFGSVSPVQLIEQHATTPFHAVRFGGGLPPRGTTPPPPDEIAPDIESRYIEQIFSAYSDHLSSPVAVENDLAGHAGLVTDLHRQRERFYSAEALRNFARDNVPPGTFESLQQEAYQGVVDTCESPHDDGFARMRETLKRAGLLSFLSSPLVTVIRETDKLGICHQLANDDRLIWVKAQ